MRGTSRIALTGMAALLVAAPADAGPVTLGFGVQPGRFTELSITPTDDGPYALRGVWSEAGYELAFEGFLSEDEGAAALGDAIGNGFASLDDCGGACFGGNSSLDTMTLRRADGRPFKLESLTARTRSSYFFDLVIAPTGLEDIDPPDQEIYAREAPYYFPQVSIGGREYQLMGGDPDFAGFISWVWPERLYDLGPPAIGSALDIVPRRPFGPPFTPEQEIVFLEESIRQEFGATPLVDEVLGIIAANRNCDGGGTGGGRIDIRGCTLVDPDFGTIAFGIYEAGGRNDTLGVVFEEMTLQEIPLPGGAALMGGALAALAGVGAARRRPGSRD